MRLKQFNVRLSEEELQLLMRVAANLGVSPSDAIRVLLQREAATLGRVHITAFDYDVLRALRDESRGDRPRGPVDLLNAVHAMHPDRMHLGNEISSSLQKLFQRRWIKAAGGHVNSWLIEPEGIEALKTQR